MLDTNETEMLWQSHPKVCHYTTYETVFKILESQKIKATHFTKLDSPNEIVYAKEVISKFIVENHPHWPLRAIEDSFARYMNDVFITSFSVSNTQIGLNENDGLLGMWRYYGHEGCAIEFDSQMLYNAFQEFSISTLNESISLAFHEVLYDIQEHHELIYNHLMDYAEFLDILFNQQGVHTIEDVRQYVDKFVELICSIKQQAFFEEKELRFTVFTNPKEDGALTANPKLKGVEHLEIPFNLACIKRIIVGPHSDQAVHMNKIQQYLQNKKLPIEVLQSSIPHAMLNKAKGKWQFKDLFN
jgi:hypothetical protein